MGTYLDKTGLQTLWTKIKERDTATLNATAKDNALLDDIAASYIALTLKGAANGVAPLDASKRIPTEYLPGYVDDVVEGTYVDNKTFKNTSGTAITGEVGKIYVSTDTNKTYRWGGSTSGYVEISASLALGETTGTAYDGAKGKAIADDLDNLLNRIVHDINEDTDQDAIADWFSLSNYLYNYYQQKLVSGTNIKTVNGQSILGSGNIAVEVDDIDMSGYYTKTEADAEFVDISSNQTITGDKTFNYIKTKYNYTQNTTKVHHAIYNADSIYLSIDEDNWYELEFPRKSGTFVVQNNGEIEMSGGGIIYKDGMNANEYAGFCISPQGTPVVISKDRVLCFTETNDYVMYTHTFTFPDKNGTVALTSDIPDAYTKTEANNTFIKVGSDLDANTFNGQQPSYYLNYNNLTNKPVIATVINEDTVQGDELATAGAVYGYVFSNYILKSDMTALTTAEINEICV